MLISSLQSSKKTFFNGFRWNRKRFFGSLDNLKSNRVSCLTITCQQIRCEKNTSANRGPDSRFVFEANIKTMWPKSSRSLILITLNGVYTKHKSQPGSKSGEYHHAYTKADFWSSNSNITWVKSLTLIWSSIPPPIKDNLRVIFE